MTEEILSQHNVEHLAAARWVFHHMADESQGQPIRTVEQCNKQGVPWVSFWYNFSNVGGVTGSDTICIWRMKTLAQCR